MGPLVISLAAGVVVLLSGLLVNGCRISKLLGGSSTEGARGVIIVSPREVRDSAIAGASAMRTANLAVSNGAGWTAHSGDSWIHVTSSGNGSHGTIRLSLDPQDLSPGTHQGAVKVQGRDSAGGSVSVPVSFLIQQPVLDVTPGDFAFTAHSSNDVFYDTLSISNGGTGPLVWTVTTAGHSDWLTLTDTSGVGAGKIPLRATNAGLSYFGTYKETIIVSAPGAENSPARIEVTIKRKRHG